MSEDESRTLGHAEEDDEVEAHARAKANEEVGDETDDDDVEAHARPSAPGDESARGL